MGGRRSLPIEQQISRGKLTKAQEVKALKNMPIRIVGVPQPPKWLSGAALDGWNRFSEILFKRSQLSEETETSLLAIALCYEEWIGLRLDLRENGHTQIVQTRDGQVERLRPAAQAFSDADKRLRAWLIEFGLTDASRGKVSVPEEFGAGADDPLARYGLN
jgi:P27 family predicted phage terminase small subunit